MPPSDGDALARPLPTTPDGDVPARTRRFEALVQGYGRIVAVAVGRVLRGTGGPQREDIQQDVMLALWRRLAREQDIEAPASYLYKAAVREAVRAVTRLRQRAELPLEDAPVAATMAAPSAEDQIVKEEQARALAAAIDGLAPERARAVRAYLAGLSVEEMMHLYGWTYQRARNLVARGVADVKSALRRGDAL